MHKTVVSQELLSAKGVKVSSLPFFSRCKVEVIRGVFHQKAGGVIIPIGVLKNHPVALYGVMQSRKETGSERKAYLNEKLLSCCFRLSKASPPRSTAKQMFSWEVFATFMQESCP